MRPNLTDEQLDDLAGWLDGGADYWVTGSCSYQTATNIWNDNRKLKPLRPVVTKRDIVRAAKRARELWPTFKWCGAAKPRTR